jgi:sulfite reductase alpha subunit-like flavoprotein
VCGLGDSGYEEFCGAGRLMSSFLAGLEAKEMVERHEIDGFIGEEEVEAAREWVRQAAAVFKKIVSGCS